MNDCGTCSECCGPAFAIPELLKPKGAPCLQLSNGRCVIYAKRPGRCRSFLCLFVVRDGAWMTPEQRPDKLGVIFHGARVSHNGHEIPGAPLAVATETRPGALDGPWAGAAVQVISQERAVLLKRYDGGADKMIGPKFIVDALKRVTIE